MCGINGLYSKRERSDELLKKLRIANNLIHHRGPDESGVFSKESSTYSVAMGMQRLSIIDLNSGAQPIYSEDGMKVIVFNGEIYNYQNLKKELLQRGVSFKTQTDTEVLLKIYENYGTPGFEKLDGMFAFSIYDQSEDQIIIGRDLFGEKPLYYYKNDSEFIWGSELKSLTTSIDHDIEISEDGMLIYFQLNYIPAPHTIYKGVKKLRANHLLKINCKNFEISEVEIQQTSNKSEDEYKDLSFDQAKLKTKELVYNSVLSRSVSDVPIGTFLSGGVDSSIISLCLAQQKEQPINTFSIGFEKDSFDETDKARTVAQLIESDHHEFKISFGDIKNELDQVLLNYDEPFADMSAIPTFLVSKLTREYVKVALTGDGGDEIFGGYNKYYVGKINRFFTTFVPQRLHESIRKFGNKYSTERNDERGLKFKIRKAVNAISYEDDYYYKIISLGFQINELKNILKTNVSNKSVFNLLEVQTDLDGIHEYRDIDRNISLEGDMLVKVDRASMLASLECRAPFLNKELWQFTKSLPEKFLLNGWNKKYILKEAFKDQFPKGFLEKPKTGFDIPVGDWFRGDLKSELLSYTETDKLKNQGIFQVSEIKEIVYNHINGKIDNTFRVWNFYCFQKWFFETHLK